MADCKFGHGLINEGELVTSTEQHRLIAKRAWMQLHKYLMVNDEPLKAVRLQVPWSLESDLEIRNALEWSHKKTIRFRSEADLREYVASDEDHYSEDLSRRAIGCSNRLDPRRQWMFDMVMSINPGTVLDVGAGYGIFTVALGNKGVNVTGLTPNEISVNFLNNYAKENDLPIEVINGLFEYTDFGDTKFDVVVAGEVIEHVPDDVMFLHKCAGLANDAVIVSTPKGSCDAGFAPNSKWLDSDAHVRSYSEERFNRLVKSIPGLNLVGDVDTIRSCAGLSGQDIECFCAVLKKEKANDHHGISTESESQLRV